MEARDAESGRGSLEAFSRRNFTKGATALTAAASVPEAFGQQPTGAPFGTVWLYIGTYTGNPASIYGRGEGIYLCELNLLHGEVNRPEARSSGIAGDGIDPIHSESIHN